MAIPAAITAGVTIYQGIQQLSSGGKEDDRLAANESAYNEAVAGDADALAFLLARSRQGQTMFVSGYGEIGGWATESARTDAANKYQQARAVLGAVDLAGTVIRSDGAQQLAQATGNTIAPGTKGEITMVLVAAAAALFLFARKR